MKKEINLNNKYIITPKKHLIGIIPRYLKEYTRNVIFKIYIYIFLNHLKETFSSKGYKSPQGSSLFHLTIGFFLINNEKSR